MTGTPKTWKAVESRIAKFLGTRRTPLSGGNSFHTRSDTLHSRLFIEIKHGSSCPRSYDGVLRLFEQTEKFAAAELKSAVVVLHEKGRWGGVGVYPAYIRTRAGTVAMVPLSALKAEGFS